MKQRRYFNVKIYLGQSHTRLSPAKEKEWRPKGKQTNQTKPLNRAFYPTSVLTSLSLLVSPSFLFFLCSFVFSFSPLYSWWNPSPKHHHIKSVLFHESRMFISQCKTLQAISYCSKIAVQTLITDLQALTWPQTFSFCGLTAPSCLLSPLFSTSMAFCFQKIWKS